ncbi:MAG: TIGR00375 family protein [Halanaerobiales bacterium]|nr:TIGR00375 family protein [Halanaerobiales bacterium]
MNDYYADMHIHIGAASNGKPVKITASRKLNFKNIVKESNQRKGLDLIGIIDCASPRVQKDISSMLKGGQLKEIKEGGFQYKKDLVIIPGAEIESREDNGGMVHYLAYFPFLDNIKEFTTIMAHYIKNTNLSTQVTGLTGSAILKIIKACNGIMVPAHLFTPHKSFYGNAFVSYKEVFSEEEWRSIPAIELGLSADSQLADRLSELAKKSFLANSDAHSLAKIAREYNILTMKTPNFNEFKAALKRKGKRKVKANYGLDPRLGKYHRSYCQKCDLTFNTKQAVLKCPNCKKKLVMGVKDRILEISDQPVNHPTYRAEYIYQIPLLDIPGIGKKTLQKLLDRFTSEMNVLHEVDYYSLKEVLNKKLADRIEKARKGQAEIISGGGGIYGKME